LVDPTQSIIFSPQFLGNGNGLVTNGPFAYWQTPSGPLIRNIGNPGGSLFSKDEIRMFLSRTRNAEILEPGASNTFNLENAHGDVHTWLGGQMEPMETSTIASSIVESKYGRVTSGTFCRKAFSYLKKKPKHQTVFITILPNI
jgi:hypothetical protein